MYIEYKRYENYNSLNHRQIGNNTNLERFEKQKHTRRSPSMAQKNRKVPMSLSLLFSSSLTSPRWPKFFILPKYVMQ